MSDGPVEAPAAGPAQIRAATRDDLPAIRDLLSRRDERRWDDASTAWFVMDLDPARCLTWIAFAGERPVGLSMMYVRELRGPTRSHRAGYWANLYIDPGYRDRLLYPRLPLLMFQEAKARGLAFVYTAVRLRDLADAHTRIGFVKLGGMPVLAKPLRPARLLGKYRGWPWLAAVSAPLDAIYGLGLAASWAGAARDLRVEPIDPASAELDSLGARLREFSGGRVAQDWSPESFAYRYRQTREGGSYRVLAIRRGDRLAGGLVLRTAERGAGIRAGVIMDVIVPAQDVPAIRAALTHAEREAHAAGCEVMMFLSGLGPEMDSVLRGLGYRRTHEEYELMLWPKGALEGHAGLGDPASWSYSLRDHDAF